MSSELMAFLALIIAVIAFILSVLHIIKTMGYTGVKVYVSPQIEYYTNGLEHGIHMDLSFVNKSNRIATIDTMKIKLISEDHIREFAWHSICEVNKADSDHNPKRLSYIAVEPSSIIGHQITFTEIASIGKKGQLTLAQGTYKMSITYGKGMWRLFKKITYSFDVDVDLEKAMTRAINDFDNRQGTIMSFPTFTIDLCE